ncbi:MAG: thiolase family protein [Waddliaceae bacterium]
MKERIAVIDGVRTPFCKAGGVFLNWEADDLGAFVVRELLDRLDDFKGQIDELIFGNVLQPPHAANIARVLAVKGGVPVDVPAFTINRNCASGLEAIATGADKIRVGGDADVILAGGTESMSNYPVLFRKPMKEFFLRFPKAKTWKEKLFLFSSLKLLDLKPEIPGIADPLCGMTMGQLGEVLAREFHVTRDEQDAYALMSQQRSVRARNEGKFADEIIPIPSPPSYAMQQEDNGIREETSLDALAKLPPVFEKETGSVTAGNSSQVTDGAAAVLLMRESKAKELGLSPLGYFLDYSCAALDPRRMGLGPVFATSKLLDKMGMTLDDISLIEINEAFAAQVIAAKNAFSSDAFARRELNRDRAVGELDWDRLNVNGGAISLGHPLGASGTRLILTLLKELKRRQLSLGLAALCIGGGQGEAAIVEVAS